MKEKTLSRRKSDIECILGFSSQKFTSVNYVFTFILGALLFAIVYGLHYEHPDQHG